MKTLFVVTVALLFASVIAHRPRHSDDDDDDDSTDHDDDHFHRFSRDPVDNCEHRECAPYTVVCSSSEYEVRDYEESYWVSTTVRSYSRSYATMTGFVKLRAYFHGANAESETVPFGLPLLVQIHSDKDVVKAATAGRNLVKLRDFSIGVFLPKSHQGQAPEPTDASVKLDHIPAQRFFVKDFGGAGIGIRKLAHAKYLADKLKANEEVFDHDWFYIARYSRPLQVSERRNEIWFFAAKHLEPACLRDVDNNVEEDTHPYTLLTTYDNGIEKREYPGGDLLYYTVTDDICELKPAIQQAFGVLKSTIMKMKKLNPDYKSKGPLILSVSRKTGGNCDKEFRMMTPIPEPFKENPGLLASFPLFSILASEGFVAYAYDTDGYFRLSARDNKGDFRRAISDLGVCYDQETFYVSIQQKPSKLFDRTNTILVPACDE